MEEHSQPEVEVRVVENKGRGVFALRSFRRGETLVSGRREAVLPGRTVHSLQMEYDIHVELDEPARLINHSCGPNTGVRNNDHGGYDFLALTDIEVGEEITFDYETTEYVSIAVPVCRCGSPVCRGRTRGYKFLPKEVRARYGERIGDYLKSGEAVGEKFITHPRVSAESIADTLR